jgi:hypothetical protein
MGFGNALRSHRLLADDVARGKRRLRETICESRWMMLGLLRWLSLGGHLKPVSVLGGSAALQRAPGRAWRSRWPCNPRASCTLPLHCNAHLAELCRGRPCNKSLKCRRQPLRLCLPVSHQCALRVAAGGRGNGLVTALGCASRPSFRARCAACPFTCVCVRHGQASGRGVQPAPSLACVCVTAKLPGAVCSLPFTCVCASRPSFRARCAACPFTCVCAVSVSVNQGVFNAWVVEVVDHCTWSLRALGWQVTLNDAGGPQ